MALEQFMGSYPIADNLPRQIEIVKPTEQVDPRIVASNQIKTELEGITQILAAKHNDTTIGFGHEFTVEDRNYRTHLTTEPLEGLPLQIDWTDPSAIDTQGALINQRLTFGESNEIPTYSRAQYPDDSLRAHTLHPYRKPYETVMTTSEPDLALLSRVMSDISASKTQLLDPQSQAA